MLVGQLICAIVLCLANPFLDLWNGASPLSLRQCALGCGPSNSAPLPCEMFNVVCRARDSHKTEMQVAESAQQGTKIRTGATLDQETNVHKAVEHVSDVSEGTMVHDLAHIHMNAPKIRIVQKKNFRDDKIRIRIF